MEGRSVAFLLPEQHILSEAFVEDVSNLLSSGEVAGLFGQEERDKIFSDLRTWAAAEVRNVLWHASPWPRRCHRYCIGTRGNGPLQTDAPVAVLLGRAGP